MDELIAFLKRRSAIDGSAVLWAVVKEIHRRDLLGPRDDYSIIFSRNEWKALKKRLNEYDHHREGFTTLSVRGIAVIPSDSFPSGPVSLEEDTKKEIS